MSNLTRIQSDMVTDPTSGSKVSDQIGTLSGSIGKNPKSYQSFADGSSRPVYPTYYATLTALQNAYPSLTNTFLQGLGIDTNTGWQTLEIDWCATQHTINTAGQGGKVTLPLGKFFLGTTELSLPVQLVLEGYGFYFGSGSSPTIPQTQLIFNMTSGNAIVNSGSWTHNHIKNIFLYNQATSNTAIALNMSSSSPHLQNVVFNGWGTGLSLNGAYYPKLYDCEWYNCTVGMNFISCYNVNLYSPTIRSCPTAITVTNQIRPLSIFGGSIENATTNAIVLPAGSSVNITGLYFELKGVTAQGNINFIQVTDNDVDINLFGNFIYLNELYAFVNASGKGNVNITSKGNKFVSVSTSSTTPYAYFLPNTGDVNIEGDDWTDALKGNYMDASFNNGAVLNFNLKAPKGVSTFHKDYNFVGRSIILPKLSTAPVTPLYGAIYNADGVSWNPLNKSANKAYFVTYVGNGAYTGLSGQVQGKATITGDGTTIQFSIPHGLAVSPSYATANPANANAGSAGINYVFVDSTNVYVVFKTAPANGTTNLVWWKAEL